MSTLSTENLEKVDEHNFDTLNSDTKGLLKTITMSCRAMGHTEEAAKYARQKHFAMLDYFGLNILFLTTTPDDECRFRVRLYTKVQNWVSLQKLSKYLDPAYFANSFLSRKEICYHYIWNLNILSYMCYQLFQTGNHAFNTTLLLDCICCYIFHSA